MKNIDIESKNARCRFIYILKIAICILFGLLIDPASAETIIVDESGGGNYTNIQAAINAANTKDTILVYSGTYYENVDVNKQLVLRGVNLGSGPPIVDAKGNGMPILISADSVNLEGFKVINSGNLTIDAGIRITSNNNTLSRNDVSDNYRGIYLYLSDNNILNYNNVTNNKKGIYLFYSANNTLNDNNASLNDNGIYWTYGILLSHSSNNNIIDNIANSNSGDGISLGESSNENLLRGNIAYFNLNSISLLGSNNNTLKVNLLANYNSNYVLYFSNSHNNTIRGNNISNGLTNLFIFSSNNNIFYQNNIFNSFFSNADDNGINQWDSGITGNYFDDFDELDEGCIDNNGDGFCDSSYNIGSNVDRYPLVKPFDARPIRNINQETFYSSIQSAIDDAITGDTIIVNSGTYYENVNITKQLTLKGFDEGGGETIIDAGGLGSAITLSINEINLEGFTVTNSSNVGTNAGVLITSDNNNVENIISTNNAVGVHIYYSNFNIITNNTANFDSIGIKITSSENNIIEKSNLTNNDYGIFLDYSYNNTLTNNTVSSNNVAGIYLWYSNQNIIKNNTAIANINLTGIYLYHSDYNTIDNNVATNNDFYGIYLSYSLKNTIMNNTASSNNFNGINLWYSSENYIATNIVEGNSWGIQFGNSLSNTIINNTIKSNYQYGIYLTSSSNNTIYNNYFNNTNNIYFSGTIYPNTWNTFKTPSINIMGGPYLGGNFWAKPGGMGFSQTTEDILNGDGICDSQYNLTSINIDYLPLITDTVPPIIDINSPLNKSYYTSSIELFLSLYSTKGDLDNRAWAGYSLDGEKIIAMTQTGSAGGDCGGSGVSNGNYSDYSCTFITQWIKQNVSISEGKHTITFYTSDDYGNNNSKSITFTVEKYQQPSISGGGGGSSGGSTGEEYENIEFKDVSRVYVSTGEDISFTFDKTGNDIQSINYKALTSAGYISATIEVLKNTSALVKHAPSGTVYKNMNIWVGKFGYATEYNIENPVIVFKVQRSWIQDNHIDEDSIKLNRYSNDVWTAMSTIRIGEDATYIYFESQTPGFSPFAITGKEEKLIDENLVLLTLDQSSYESVDSKPTPTKSEPPISSYDSANDEFNTSHQKLYTYINEIITPDNPNLIYFSFGLIFISIIFAYNINKSYNIQEYFLLLRNKNKKSKLLIKRTVYDPTKEGEKSFFVSDSNLQYPDLIRSIKEHPPLDYWYVLRIENEGDSIYNWEVSLDPSDNALSVIEAYIKGYENPIAVKSHFSSKDKKDKYYLLIKNSEIPIPNNSFKTIIFRLNIDCNTPTQLYYSISGEVNANRKYLIKKKDFPFSCDIRYIKERIKDPEEAEKFFSKKFDLYPKDVANIMLNITRLYLKIESIDPKKIETNMLKNYLFELRTSIENVKSFAGIEKPLELIDFTLGHFKLDVHPEIILKKFRESNIIEIMINVMMNKEIE